MPAGNEKIAELGKNTRFTSENQPKNRGVSIKNEVRKFLEVNGRYRIEAKDVIEINEDGSVDVRMTKKEAIAKKILKIASKGSNSTTLNAIKMLIEHFDGKPIQTTKLMGNEGEPVQINITKTYKKEEDGK